MILGSRSIRQLSPYHFIFNIQFIFFFFFYKPKPYKKSPKQQLPGQSATLDALWLEAGCRRWQHAAITQQSAPNSAQHRFLLKQIWVLPYRQILKSASPCLPQTITDTQSLQDPAALPAELTNTSAPSRYACDPWGIPKPDSSLLIQEAQENLAWIILVLSPGAKSSLFLYQRFDEHRCRSWNKTPLGFKVILAISFLVCHPAC